MRRRRTDQQQDGLMTRLGKLAAVVTLVTAMITLFNWLGGPRLVWVLAPIGIVAYTVVRGRGGVARQPIVNGAFALWAVLHAVCVLEFVPPNVTLRGPLYLFGIEAFLVCVGIGLLQDLAYR